MCTQPLHGYTKMISLLLYTTSGHTSSDIDLVYTAGGYASNDINLGCTTIRNIELGMLAVILCSHAVILLVCTAIGYACSDFILTYTAYGYTNNDINPGCITIRKIELRALIQYRIFVYARSVYTQLLGMLAVK